MLTITQVSVAPRVDAGAEGSGVGLPVFQTHNRTDFGSLGATNPFYDTPEGFCMPPGNTALHLAFTLWVAGNGVKKVKPYRSLNSKSFGPTVKYLQNLTPSVDFKKDHEALYKVHTPSCPQPASLVIRLAQP